VSKEVQITYQLPTPEDENETYYTIDLECRISRAEHDVGWLGHLEDYDVLSCTPQWPFGIDRLYDALKSHEAEIEQCAFAAEDE
jgi:hypothetical protein